MAPEFDLTIHSIDDPASLWVVLNKAREPLPADFVPPGLVDVGGGKFMRFEAAGPLADMLAESGVAGVKLRVLSALRTSADQARIHDDLTQRLAAETAERVSARPRYSEHELGLAVDLGDPDYPECDFATCFAQVRAGQWVAQNAHLFGFIVRYTEQGATTTGYDPEGWHLRFVGNELASYMYDNGAISLENVFGLTGAAKYPDAR